MASRLVSNDLNTFFGIGRDSALVYTFDEPVRCTK